MDIRDVDTVETASPGRSRKSCLALSVVALLLIAAAAAVAFCPWVRSRLLGRGAPTVPLRVASTPDGADVFIDDQLAGSTPLSVQLAPGPHRLRVVKRGHRPWNEVVDPAATPEVATTLTRVKLAKLFVDSEPDRADVFLDEERRGTTPIEIPDVEAGVHTLLIRKEPLFQPSRQQIELKEGEERRLMVRLDSGLERLYVERIAKEPTKLSNHTELVHLHLLNGDAEKAAEAAMGATVALCHPDLAPTEMGQFFEEVRKLMRGQAGALREATREKLFASLILLLEKMMTAAPAEYTRYDPVVTLFIQAERFDDVARACEKTVALPSGRGLVHYYVATICLRLGELSKAIRLLERAVELQPTLLSARMSLGSAYHRAERLDDAMRQYAEAEKLVKDSSPYYQGYLHVEVARLLVSRKDIEGAVARYKKALAANAPTAYACEWRMQLAELLHEQGRKAEAIEHYKQVVQLTDPDSKIGILARKALRRLSEK